MHNHTFIPSSKKDISYCKICQKLSYKGIISQSLNCHFKYNMDPLTLKFKPFSNITNYKSIHHLKYIKNKKIGIEKIKFLIYEFGLKPMIFYKSISLLDEIYLQNEVSIENIEIIACICVLLATEFNGCCVPDKEDNSNKKENDILFHSSFNCINNRKKTNIFGLFQYIKNNLSNYMYWEVLCLKYLNYDLGKYSAYDYLILFFGLGIFFCEDTIDIISKLNNCLMILDLIINDPKSCDYSQYIITMSIIKLAFEGEKCFDKKIFKNIYGIDLSKKKYINCSNMIRDILKVTFNCNFNVNYNNSILNNCNYINNYTFIENLINDSDRFSFCLNAKNNNNTNKKYKNNDNKFRGNLYNNEFENNKIILIDSNINEESKIKYICDLVQK